MERLPITREGYDRILEEIRELEEVQMPAVTERIKDAREEGDLKENAEYHAAREQQGYLQAKINQLKGRLAQCTIVDASDLPKGVIGFGSIVVVKDLSDGMNESYQLVGPGDEDYGSDPVKILTTSPMAQAMMGKKVGDKFEAEIPAGTLKMEVVEITDP